MPGPGGHSETHKIPEALHNLYSNPFFKIPSQSWQQQQQASSSSSLAVVGNGKSVNSLKIRKAAEAERWAALQERQRKRNVMTMGKALALMGFVTWSGMLKKLYKGGGTYTFLNVFLNIWEGFFLKINIIYVV